ncbi:MAG: bifunctional [glutamate--ammonia ligase]-adenylyl-L-tyrosine phosphorylase/[glutamate--ammonia-ligase] adenylyltransferase [Deltaproteobacteria bacterium]|nr:bifunctional [glutamate--ammonia ligase]-adenylyl-L-tyrosine phosphorylase/[glutamate--ammonia-ligase] adenylyltransferase [Deltaproteobacteria bacterium]
MGTIKHFLQEGPSRKRFEAFLAPFRLRGTPSVRKNLASLQKLLAPHCDPERFLLRALHSIGETADSEQALNQLERFFHALDDPATVLPLLTEGRPALHTLCTLFGASPYLSGILIQEPSLFAWLMQERIWSGSVDREALLEEILMACTEIEQIEEAYPILRRVKQREILRIGAKDLTGFAGITETMEGLTALAEASLEAARQVADRFLKKRFGTPQIIDPDGNPGECPFAILGMGKLGGEELNFSSDIDLLYLYESDQGETTGIPDTSGRVQGKIENHLYFARLCERITDMIQANTEDGFVFRVDLRLRPEGGQGPVASSLRSYELYYESFGQTWERAAHLKCRPVAGDLALGRKMIRLLRPFVYRKYLDDGAIAEIREMKGRILQKLARGRAREFNVKLGPGGIRSIEFLIQSLQLLFGGKIHWVREHNSLRALHRLCDKEIITYDDYAVLSKAYLFLRDVEHKLQIEHQLQTQTLPKDPAALDCLAYRCGLSGGRELMEELSTHTARVEALFEELFRQEEEGTESISPLPAIASGIAEGDEAARELAHLGFADPRRALKNIEILREGPPYHHNSSRCRAAFLQLAPALLREAGTSPDPDMALNHLERFASGYQARETFYAILGKNSEALHRIIALFSISSYLSNLLIRHPGAMEILLGGDLLEQCVLKDSYYRRIMEEVKRSLPGGPVLDLIRRFKHLEELKIGLRDILSEPDLLQTAHSLSGLADASLEAAYTLAFEELTKVFGPPRAEGGEPAELAIFGVGKLGSQELIYGGDLDLLFAYTAEGETEGPERITNRDFFTRLASRIVSLLSTLTGEGAAYRIDLRLRPLGESGPLVQSLEGYRGYFHRSLMPWERQALTRIRFCAGGNRCGRALIDVIETTLFDTAPLPDLAESVRTMRKKIEAEKSTSRRREIHFKTGAGGLIDIEFLVQYLTLRYGHTIKELRFAPPLSVLEVCRNRSLIGETDYQGLRKGYLFLRRLEGRARILQDRPITSLSSDPGMNRALALRMGYPVRGEDPGTALLRDLKITTQRTRKIFERILSNQKAPGLT